MELTYRPIQSWPGPQRKARRDSQFRAQWGPTLRLLDAELRHLRARNIVLQVALPEEQIRLDGKPRAGAKYEHPGVILSFDTPDGPLSFPSDRFKSGADNIRAIALTLEHLRAIDRYGVSGRGEQYRGWRQLTAAGGTGGAQWWAVLGVDRAATRTEIESAYKVRAALLHPDRTGEAEPWHELQEAIRQARQARPAETAL